MQIHKIWLNKIQVTDYYNKLRPTTDCLHIHAFHFYVTVSYKLAEHI